MTTTLTKTGAVTLFENLEKKLPEFQKALQNNVKADHFLRVAITAMQQNPAILDCTERSIHLQLMRAAELSLMCDGMLGQAYLVPFNNKKAGNKQCELILGYKGLRELALRTGRYTDIFAQVVYDGDPFKIQLGTNRFIDHEPQEIAVEDYDPKNPPKKRGCYAVARHADGSYIFRFWFAYKIEAHKKQYSKSWERKDSIWQTNPEIAYEKTMIRKLCNSLQLGVKAERVLAREDRMEAGLDVTPIDRDLAIDITSGPEHGGNGKGDKKGVEGLTEDLKKEQEEKSGEFGIKPAGSQSGDDQTGLPPQAEIDVGMRAEIEAALLNRHPNDLKAREKLLAIWCVKALKSSYREVDKIPAADLGKVIDEINKE